MLIDVLFTVLRLEPVEPRLHQKSVKSIDVFLVLCRSDLVYDVIVLFFFCQTRIPAFSKETGYDIAGVLVLGHVEVKEVVFLHVQLEPVEPLSQLVLGEGDVVVLDIDHLGRMVMQDASAHSLVFVT